MRLPRLVRFLLLHAAVGVGAGWAVLAGLLVTDTGGLAGLVFGASAPALPLGMLMFGTAITFGGAAMGAGVMTLPYDGAPPRRRGQWVWAAARRLAGYARPPAIPARAPAGRR